MESKNNLRVRFAPSPTGYLHIGGLRTALFNYLFARHAGGKFILRIEDTDQTRKVEGAVENLINTLKIMGLDYDEGPEIEGDYGPYFQSERLELYKKYANELIENGNAYYAFETPEELEEMRKIQQKLGQQTMYDRRARNLTEAEVKEKLEKGLPYVIRLKVPLDTEIKFNDLIRGTVKFDTNLIDDQVLMKSDGFPTYHFANVIDDHLMKITHVIRGEEWLTSVPKHILLYNALGWEVPEMAHVPLILNPDKTKLSKRQGDVATEDFLKKGYLPEALLNFIALLGWNPGEGESREIFSKEELIKLFSIEKVNSSGAVFNREKLDWMNKQYIQMTVKKDPIKFSELASPYLKNFAFDFKNVYPVSATAATYSSTLAEIPKVILELYPSKVRLNEEQKKFLTNEFSQKVISSLVNKIKILDNHFWESASLDYCKNIVKEIQEETGFKGKQLYQPLRYVLTGNEHGPELGQIIYDLLKGLGKESFLERIYENFQNT